jgi:uncharacterized protein (DUF983 family)
MQAELNADHRGCLDLPALCLGGVLPPSVLERRLAIDGCLRRDKKLFLSSELKSALYARSRAMARRFPSFGLASMKSDPSPRTSLFRGLTRRCPNCGVGSLFSSYLKPRDSCEHCRESFAGLEADDGPAWLTVGAVTIIVVSLLFILESSGRFSYAVEMLIVLPLTIVLALLLLPLTKGFFISALWLLSRKPN